MLKCEGYKMFKGSATITPLNSAIPKFTITGTWLFKPDTGCWYCGGRSFPEKIVSDFIEEVEN